MKSYDITGYFDYAAATPMDDSVQASMQPFLKSHFYNPSALYLAAQDVKKSINEARASIAKLMGVQPVTLTFTAGVTESNNIFLQGMARAYPNSHMLISSIEHESVAGVVDYLAEQGLIEYDLIPVDENGKFKTKELYTLIRPNTTVISIIHAHNEFGTIQDMRTIAHVRDNVLTERAADGNNLPLVFHSDCAQTPNYLSIAVDGLGVDALSLSAAKVYGPKQVGLLYTQRSLPRLPFMAGGGQEHGMRAGTENAAGIVGFATALSLAQKNKELEQKRLKKLQKKLETGLGEIANAHVHATGAGRLPSLVSVHFDGVEGERLSMELDEAGFQLGTGSACNASSGEPSSSLLAIGLTREEASSSIRIAMGRHTTEESVEKLLTTIKKLVA